MFNAEKYKIQLQNSTNINEVEKVPLPVIRDDQNYIFISYSHKDYKQVYSDLADMYEAGARFRYDAEFLLGLEWDEEQVQTIIESPRCVGVIFYLSVEFLKNESIYKQIGMIAESSKPSFVVNLTNLSPMEVFNLAKREVMQPLLLSAQNDLRDLEDISRMTDNFQTIQKIIFVADQNNPSTFILSRSDKDDYREKLTNVIKEKFNVIPDFRMKILFEGDYEGEWKEGKRHGHGTIITTAKYKYEGNWENDKPDGKGVLTYPEGSSFSSYTGEWKDGKMDGHGVLIYSDGRKYIGEWKENRLEGKGLFTYKDKSTYEGDFVDWKKHGHGVYRLANETTYDCEWKDDKREGHGVCRYANGDTYDGEWKDGTFEGHGVYQFANGDTYDGEFKDDKREGHGVCRYANGDTYDGEWKNGKFEGHGVYRFADGATYDGEWKDGKFEGHGVCRYANGDTYDGEWKDGKREGHGVYRFANGNTYDGEWKDGKRHGHGTMLWESSLNSIFMCSISGNFYEGEWENDKINGHGKMTYAITDSEKRIDYIGEWKDGKRHGHGVTRFKNGLIYDGEYRDDKCTWGLPIEYENRSEKTQESSESKISSSGNNFGGGTTPAPKYVSPGIVDNGYGPYCYNARELVDDIIDTNKSVYGTGTLGYSHAKEEINNSYYLTSEEKKEALEKLDPYHLFY